MTHSTRSTPNTCLNATATSLNANAGTSKFHKPSPGRRPLFKIAASLLTVAPAAGALAVGGASPASADSGITTTGDVNLRSGPGTEYAILDVVPAGTSPIYLCWEHGENINGVDVWMRVDVGTLGDISSFYDDSSYPTDDEITAKYGIPPCTDYDAGTTPASDSSADDSGVTSTMVTDGTSDPFDRQAAASWAYENATEPQDFAAGCTWFVSNALWAGGLQRTGDWTDSGGHGNWPWSRRPGTASATAVVPFLDFFLNRYPFSQVIPLDLSHNPVPQAQPGDMIAYDWEGDGTLDHLSLVTSISAYQYPNVAEWGTVDFTYGHASIDYHERGWTWSANSSEWLQNKYAGMTAELIHVDTTHESTY